MSSSQEVPGDAAPGLLEASAAWWHVVWCHERCHKQERQVLRSDLNEAALAAGAELVCFKKAKQFGSWLQRGKATPFILLTDWREVKPCMDEWWQAGIGSRPSFTVVVVEDPKHFGKVVAWAAALKWDPVHVVRGFVDTHALIASMASILPIWSAPMHLQFEALNLESTCLADGGNLRSADLWEKIPDGRATEAAPEVPNTGGGALEPFVASICGRLGLDLPIAYVGAPHEHADGTDPRLLRRLKEGFGCLALGECLSS